MSKSSKTCAGTCFGSRNLLSVGQKTEGPNEKSKGLREKTKRTNRTEMFTEKSKKDGKMTAIKHIKQKVIKG